MAAPKKRHCLVHVVVDCAAKLTQKLDENNESLTFTRFVHEAVSVLQADAGH